jgi:hypothetical protein
VVIEYKLIKYRCFVQVAYGPGIVRRLRERYQLLAETRQQQAAVRTAVQTFAPQTAAMSTPRHSHQFASIEDLTAARPSRHARAPPVLSAMAAKRDRSIDSIVATAQQQSPMGGGLRSLPLSETRFAPGKRVENDGAAELEFLQVQRRLRHVARTFLGDDDAYIFEPVAPPTVVKVSQPRLEQASPPNDPAHIDLDLPSRHSLMARQSADTDNNSDTSPPPDEPHPPIVSGHVHDDATVTERPPTAASEDSVSEMSDSDVDTYDVQAATGTPTSAAVTPAIVHVEEPATEPAMEQLDITNTTYSSEPEETIRETLSARYRQQKQTPTDTGEVASADTTTVIYETEGEPVLSRRQLAASAIDEGEATVKEDDPALAPLASMELDAQPEPDIPLTEHPEREFIEKMLNIIDEEDIADFIASLRERFRYSLEGEHGLVVGKSVITKTKVSICIQTF